MRTGSSMASCTGVMIDTYHVLTAGHCVNGVNGGGWADEVVFSAGQNGNQLYDAGTNSTFRRSDLQYYGEANWTWARSYTEWTNNDNWDFDMALVTLDRNVGSFTGWFGYGYTTDNNFYTGNTATTAGYPADLTPSVDDMWTASGNAANHSITTNQLRTTDIDIWPGQSGSPVWYGGPSEHGIVSYQSYTDSNGNGQYDPGEPQLYNGFMRLTSGKFNDLGAWRTEDNSVRPPTDRADLVNYDDWFNTTSAYMSTGFVTPGGNYSVTAFPRNNGTAYSGGYTVSFYASTNSTISTSDYLLGSVAMNSLAPFAWDTATLNLTSSFPSIPANSYYVGWIIDVNGSVGEFREDNNTGFVKTTLLNVGTDDHGNSAGLATRVFDKSVTGGNLESAGDHDWFSFTASAGTQVTLQTALGSLGDTVMRLYAGDGLTQLAFNDDYPGIGLASHIDYTIPTWGLYYVSVEDYGNNDPGTYSLSLTHLDDHGDSFLDATPISTNTTTSGNLGVGGDVDMFSFYGIANSTVTLETGLGTLPDSILRLYDPGGTEIASNDDYPGLGLASHIDIVIPANGTYFARVEDYGTPDPGTFSLTLTASTVVNGDFDNNGVYDCADIDALVAGIASHANAANLDLNGDLLVNLADRDIWLALAGAANLPSGNPYLLGDATLDGVVDVSDFNAWNSHKFSVDPAWCHGDFTADGIVDVSDFNVWNTSKFTSALRPLPLADMREAHIEAVRNRINDAVAADIASTVEDELALPKSLGDSFWQSRPLVVALANHTRRTVDAIDWLHATPDAGDLIGMHLNLNEWWAV